LISNEIERKIADFRAFGIPLLVDRDCVVHVVDQMVSTIIGCRRSGKSFRALQVANDLINNKFIQSIGQICYLDFDNPIFSSLKKDELQHIQTTFFKVTSEIDIHSQLVFIFDEIHKINGWEEFVIDLSRNPKWKVIVTGSSSKLLKQDIATELRGKAISSEIYPLSFKEFLRFKQISIIENTTKTLAEIRRLFEIYLRWGAYPAITKMEEQTAEHLLREYFDTMILKDVIQRYSVSKPLQCTQLYHYLLSLISKPVTLKSAYAFLRQSGFSTSKESIRDYIQWAQDSWLFFMVPTFSDSITEQERNYKKLYAIDWALAQKNSLSWDGSYSRAFENIIFITLKRKWHRTFYYQTHKKKQEVDFLVVDSHGKPAQAIQACMDITDSKTFKREIYPLLSTAQYFGFKDAFIITMDQREETIKESNCVIHIIPIWKWLLEQD